VIAVSITRAKRKLLFLDPERKRGHLTEAMAFRRRM
jgi:hypothetical protein